MQRCPMLEVSSLTGSDVGEHVKMLGAVARSSVRPGGGIDFASYQAAPIVLLVVVLREVMETWVPWTLRAIAI